MAVVPDPVPPPYLGCLIFVLGTIIALGLFLAAMAGAVAALAFLIGA